MLGQWEEVAEEDQFENRRKAEIKEREEQEALEKRDRSNTQGSEGDPLQDEVNKEDELKEMRRLAEKGNLDENMRRKETYIDDQPPVTGKSGGFKKRKSAKGTKKSLVEDGE